MRYFKYSLFFILLFTAFLSAQSGRKPIYIESNTAGTGVNTPVFISFKVPYSNLVFIKQGDKYTSGMTFSMEIYDLEDNLVKRETLNEYLSVFDYKATENRDLYLQGVIETHLDPGDYTFQPLVDLENTNRSIKLEKFLQTVPEENAALLFGTVVSENDVNCDHKKYRLVNNDKNVPFGKDSTLIFIPVEFAIDDNPVIKISKDEKEVLLTPEYYILNNTVFNLVKCNSNITAELVDENPTNILVIHGIFNELEEGRYKLTIQADTTEYISDFEVNWIDKPLSLSNTEYAVKLLKIAFGDDPVDNILSRDEEQWYPALVDYWKQYDPVDSTVFNELMNEYYERADFAIRNFSSLDTRDGAETDRGETFIKFGEPDSISRGSNDNDNITEVWYYNEAEKSFIFVDETGLGNYIMK